MGTTGTELTRTLLYLEFVLPEEVRAQLDNHLAATSRTLTAVVRCAIETELDHATGGEVTTLDPRRTARAAADHRPHR